MLDLKVINSVLNQLEDERGVPRERAIEAVEQAVASAYKKEYGKKDQDIRVDFDPEAGELTFYQVKTTVDESTVYTPDEDVADDDPRERFDPERHIWLEDARKIKKRADLGEEIVFDLENKDDYGRISTQTAKQVIIQKIREAEKESVHEEFAEKKGEIVNGKVQRFERGKLYVDLGRATGVMPYKEQIQSERFRQGERIRALLLAVDESSGRVQLRLSRASEEFLHELFALEAPEVESGVVEIKAIAREAGERSKVAVHSDDEYIDPVGACVGQRGVRVSTVMSELGNEKIDIIEWSDNPEIFIEKALSPAEVMRVDLDEDQKQAVAFVTADQQSLAIGKGGQNARLAAKLTGWTVDVQALNETNGEGDGPDEPAEDEAAGEEGGSAEAAEHEGANEDDTDSAAENDGVNNEKTEGTEVAENDDENENPPENGAEGSQEETQETEAGESEDEADSDESDESAVDDKTAEPEQEPSEEEAAENDNTGNDADED